MLRTEKLDAYRKMKLWINELPEDNHDIKTCKISEYPANQNISWLEGILCLELRIAPRVISNYGMLNLKFTKTDRTNFQVIYKTCDSEEVVESEIAVLGDVVRNGMVKMYLEAIEDFFDELSAENIFPCGVLEILDGRHSEIGTSNMAVKIILNILLKLFTLNRVPENLALKEIILKGCKSK